MITNYAVSFLQFIRNPRRQLSIVILTIFYCFGIVAWQYQKTRYADPIQQVLEVHPRVFQLASHVTVGLHINNFPEFSFRENKFTLDTLVWFAFPVGTESLHTIKEFSFQNGKILHKSLPTIKIVENVAMISFQAIVDFKAYLDYTFFPMADHRLNIVLENRSVTPNELCFLSSVHNFALAEEILTSTWMPRRKIVKAGYVKSMLSDHDTSLETSYPCVSFTLEFANTSIRDLVSLYFPLFILFLFGLFSLLIDVRKDALRTTVLVTSMPSLALFRLVIDQIAPSSSNITRIDLLYYALVSLALCMVLFQVYSLLVFRLIGKELKNSNDPRVIRLEVMNSALFLFVIAALISMISYIHIQ